MSAALQAIREYIASEGHDGFRAELRAAVFICASFVVFAVGVAALGGN